jgi:hypothetical protein
MRALQTWVLLACVLNSVLALPAGATQDKDCITGREWCENSCTTVMLVEAMRCSTYGNTVQAVIYHAENMSEYGGCLSECRQVWGSNLYSNQVE